MSFCGHPRIMDPEFVTNPVEHPCPNNCWATSAISRRPTTASTSTSGGARQAGAGEPGAGYWSTSSSTTPWPPSTCAPPAPHPRRQAGPGGDGRPRDLLRGSTRGAAPLLRRDLRHLRGAPRPAGGDRSGSTRPWTGCARASPTPPGGRCSPSSRNCGSAGGSWRGWSSRRCATMPGAWPCASWSAPSPRPAGRRRCACSPSICRSTTSSRSSWTARA